MRKSTLVRIALLALALTLGSLELLLPKDAQAGPCPRIGCPSGFCKQDSDCTAAAGGTCNHFCPSMGCCVY